MYYLTGLMQGGGVAASWSVTKSWFCINAFWGLCRGEMVAAFVSGYFAVLDGAAGATVYAAEAHCAIAVPAGRAVGRCERDVVHGALRHASSA